MRSLLLNLFCLVFVSSLLSCAASAPIAVVNEPLVDTLVIPIEDTLIFVEEVTLPYRPSRTRTIDLIHTKLELSFDWEKQSVLGIATLELKPFYYPQSTLVLDAKGFEIHGVELIGENNMNLDYEYNGEELKVALDREYHKSESIFLRIDYTAKPAELEVIYGDAIAEDRGLYFINPDSTELKPMQIWTQGEPEANRCWFPTIDAPNERSTQEMYLTVNQRFTTLSNGSLIYSKTNNDGTRTDYWKMEQAHAPYLFMLAVGEFEVVKETWNDIEVSYYVEPEYASSAKGIFGHTPEMLTFFSNVLNYPFPWEKYSQIVVRDFVSGAMENTTASVFMQDLQIDNRELIDFNWDDIIAHELFHQWFGDLVTTESWANLSLNEAFATYSEYLWYEYKYGKDEADLHLMQDLANYLNEAVEKKVEVIRYYHDDPNDMFDNHTYAKGGAILHMLRNYVGDEAFFDALNLYLRTHKYSSVEVHDLRQAFESVVGEDLNWFFNQWFLSPGHPVLQVDQQYDSGLLKIRVEQLQDTELYPIYELPLLVDIWEGEEAKRYSLVVTDELHEFQFELANKPDLVIWDAEQQLLGEILHPKSFRELVYQYQYSQMVRPKYEAISTLLDSIDQKQYFEVVFSALNDSIWQIRQVAIDAFDEYNGVYKEELEKKLVSIIQDDPKSLVRADALTVLSSIAPGDYKEVFHAALNDSSYAVLGSALYAMAQTGDSTIQQIYAGYETVENINVVIPLAASYAITGNTEKYDWFISKMQKMTDSGLYYMVNLFGQYLMYSDPNLKEKGSRYLEGIARAHSSSTIRLSAFQSLGLIDELESVKAMKQDIVDQETDEELKELFIQFQ